MNVYDISPLSVIWNRLKILNSSTCQYEKKLLAKNKPKRKVFIITLHFKNTDCMNDSCLLSTTKLLSDTFCEIK